MFVLSRNMKKYQNFLFKNFHVLVVKFSVYLNRHVFVMNTLSVEDALLKLFISPKGGRKFFHF